MINLLIVTIVRAAVTGDVLTNQIHRYGNIFTTLQTCITWKTVFTMLVFDIAAKSLLHELKVLSKVRYPKVLKFKSSRRCNEVISAIKL